MNVEKLILVLAKLALVENPNLHDGSEKNQAYLEGLRSMAQLYVEVGSDGKVASADTDTVLLATIGYEESRHKPKSPDGDCMMGGVCQAVGPMQVSKSTPWVLGRIDPIWKGAKVDDIRDPRRNVEAAYRLLQHWNNECAGSTTENLLGNWSAGKCIKGTIHMGAHRCHLAKAIGEAVGVEMAPCRRAASPRTQSLVSRFKKRLGAQSATKPTQPKPEEKKP